MRYLYLTFLFLFCSGFLYAQTQNQHSGWLASFNTIGLKGRWSLHFDAQLRSTDKLEHVQALLLRPGLNYHFNKRFSATVGYAFIPTRRSIPAATDYVTEHRLWEQLLYSHKWEGISTAHRLRLEQRFIPVTVADNYNLKVVDRPVTHRLRYFLRNVIPFKDRAAFTKGPFAALQDEVFLNIARTQVVKGRTFDQNRLYAAFGYRLRNVDLEAGYIYQYIQGASNAVKNHIVQVAVYTRL